MTTALTYLRVSSTKQLRPDLGPEGLSIPAQRAACEATARKLGVTIIEEYVEPGRSGTTITARPALQSLLDRAANDSGVDHVIVYDLSRLARNRADDVAIVTQLAANGVKLISTAENIDETPVGQLTHGLLAAVNEYRSARDGVDISYKMRRKAEQGGTLGQAPIGYINTIERRGGRDIRGIEIDPKRCPLVREAFEVSATEAHRLAGRLRFACLPTPATLDGFDYDAAPGVDRHLIRELGTCAYLESATNVLLIGPPGTGKTHGTAARIG
ncbi:recombinase family protein, partial [Gordonia sp. HS-NH1]|uniref:recombinase family protein n=1 Tax=Gordonia sp. HS-NH1 TaxID=1435068 RepID=UPI0018D14722